MLHGLPYEPPRIPQPSREGFSISSLLWDPWEKIIIPHEPALDRATQLSIVILPGAASITIPHPSAPSPCPLPGPSGVEEETLQCEVIRPSPLTPEQSPWSLHLLKRSPDAMAVSNGECRASLWGQLLPSYLSAFSV